MGLWEKRHEPLQLSRTATSAWSSCCAPSRPSRRWSCWTSPAPVCPPRRRSRSPTSSAGLAGDTTLLFCAHDMDLVFNLADSIMVLYFGEIIAKGLPQEISADPKVQEIYLGSGRQLLELENINTFYGDTHVLWDLSLKVPQGTLVAILGRNGMGKTTIIRSIMGLPAPTSGVVRFNGEADQRAGALPDRAQGHRARASGADRLPVAHRQGEPAGRGQRQRGRGCLGPGEVYDAVPHPEGAAAASVATS